MKNSNKSLVNIVIIVLITSVISGLTIGVIIMNNYKSSSGVSYSELLKDENLEEFLEIYASVANDYYEEVDKKELIDKAVEAMIEYLGDDYSTYLNKNQSNELASDLNGKYEGIGISIDKNLIIQDITKDSPAEKAGLVIGDKLIEIDGTSLEGESQALASLLIHNKDKVEIIVERDNIKLVFEIETATLESSAISYKMIEETKIGYIYISIFSSNLTNQMKEALTNLENDGMEKLIIDVRDNSGGYLKTAGEVSSIFLEKGKTIYSLESKSYTDSIKDETTEHKEYPIIVLINSSTASSAEILASSLKDSYGAILIGKKSYGKGTVQQTLTLSDGSMAKYTSAKWIRANGESINKIGIEPDFNIENEYVYDEDGKTVKEIIDNQFNKAIEIMKET